MGPANTIMGMGKCNFPVIKKMVSTSKPRINWEKKTIEKSIHDKRRYLGVREGSDIWYPKKAPYAAIRITSIQPPCRKKRSINRRGRSVVLSCTIVSKNATKTKMAIAKYTFRFFIRK
jgi:hypothetical protein